MAMERTTETKSRRTRFNSDRFRLPSELCRARPWQISPLPKKTMDAHPERIVYSREYGLLKVIVRSTDRQGLLHEDLSVFIALCDRVGESNAGARMMVTPADIAKAMGLANPWGKSTREAIHASLKRLFAAYISVVIRDEKGNVRCKGRFNFIQGKLYYSEDGTFTQADITISRYMEEIQRLGLGYYWLSHKVYYSLRGNIAQALYTFLLNQRPIYSGQEKGYEIRLSKLCDYLNYDPGKRPWSNVWQTFRSALSQLKALGAIKDFSRDSKRLQESGGVITIIGVKKEEAIDKLRQESEPKMKITSGKKETKPESKERAGDVKALFDKRFKVSVTSNSFYADVFLTASRLFNFEDDVRLAKALLEFHDEVDKEQCKHLSQELRWLLPGPKTIVKNYMEWIEDNAWIIHRPLSLLDIRHSLFQRYRREEAHLDTCERDPLTGKSYWK
jgi:hypothetical protein